MSILSPTDRAVLWRTAITSGPEERRSLLRVLAAEILASVGRRLDLYGGYEDEVIDTVEILDQSGLLGRDDLREAFEEADEDEDHAETFTALLISHLSAAADIERLGVGVRLKAMRLAGAWQLHIADRAQAGRQWLTAAQVAASTASRLKPSTNGYLLGGYVQSRHQAAPGGCRLTSSRTSTLSPT